MFDLTGIDIKVYHHMFTHYPRGYWLLATKLFLLLSILICLFDSVIIWFLYLMLNVMEYIWTYTFFFFDSINYIRLKQEMPLKYNLISIYFIVNRIDKMSPSSAARRLNHISRRMAAERLWISCEHRFCWFRFGVVRVFVFRLLCYIYCSLSKRFMCT